MYQFVAGFSALQAYAVYGKDKRVFSFVTAMGAINPILNIVGFVSLATLHNLIYRSIIARRSQLKRIPLHSRVATKTWLSGTAPTYICEFPLERPNICADNAENLPAVSVRFELRRPHANDPLLCTVVCGVVAAFVSKVVVLALIWRRLAGDLSVLRRLKIKTSCAALLWRDGSSLSPCCGVRWC